MAGRNFLLWFLGSKARARAEWESRHWIAECPNCHTKTSLWDLGGIRYKTSGDNSWAGYPCRVCGKFGMHRIVWDGTSKDQSP